MGCPWHGRGLTERLALAQESQHELAPRSCLGPAMMLQDLPRSASPLPLTNRPDDTQLLLHFRRFIIRRFGSADNAFLDVDCARSSGAHVVSQASFADALVRKWEYCGSSRAAQLFSYIAGEG